MIARNESAGIVSDTKLFSTLRAQLALRRIVLHRTDQRDGGVLFVAHHAKCAQWAKAMSSLAEVEAFARQIGAS
jgi:hypothetical protein